MVTPLCQRLKKNKCSEAWSVPFELQHHSDILQVVTIITVLQQQHQIVPLCKNLAHCTDTGSGVLTCRFAYEYHYFFSDLVLLSVWGVFISVRCKFV